jgi:hypothetical protein
VYLLRLRGHIWAASVTTLGINPHPIDTRSFYERRCIKDLAPLASLCSFYVCSWAFESSEPQSFIPVL